MRVLVVQETDWIDRNPILHHRMLEALSIGGDEITVLDYEILWGRRGWFPLWQPRRVWRDTTKVLAGSHITVVRPAMLRVPGMARPSWLLASWWELRRYMRESKPDVVVGYGISNAFLARLYARRLRIPFVFHLFDSLHALAEPAILRPFAAMIERRVLRSADQVVIAYRPLGRYVARMGVLPDRVTFIPTGTTQRRPDHSVRTLKRSQLGIADGEIALLFIGWLYRDSGLIELANELSMRIPRYSKYKLIIVGDGDLSSDLEALRAADGLRDRLILTGRRPVGEMADFIAASDVCLLPSKPSKAMQFVVPSKVDEYLELGRPVISTRLAGMRAEFEDSAGIIWVDRPEDILPRLDSLLSGPTSATEVLAELSRAASNYAAGREDWDAVAARFRRVLASTRPRTDG